eukprot:CAMPEP_0113871186 /NCGR_PEP_ID=MMETSP0780_2-20120614/2503_1 /TAXON_ID=652834 /ORGANISM="Palpitomonas bilix" /LENGTH=331 /DNA_ID=CAMNT_0000856549 /DNA_START=93 /DNA_END=1088 /DNA_ORIENTATION=+ /assembly_acc=CAM_ASM_000599
MRVLLVVFAVIAAANALPMLDQETVAFKDMVDQINSKGTTWTAGYHKGFKYTKTPSRFYNVKRERALPVVEAAFDGSIPESFDVRENWPECASVTGFVRDQADCGSCWAFGSTEAFNDRLCIASGGQFTTLLSPQDTASCCSSCGYGCDGGDPSAAWEYFTNTGIVTGGAYGDNSTCYPYGLPRCLHHTKTGDYPPCPSGEEATPSCKRSCQSSYGKSFSDDKHFAKSAYSVSSSEQNIQKELMSKGTITASMDVYADFEAYTGGVYQHTTGQYLGGHSIKMIGWGVDNGTKYWLMQNSWNQFWGEKGTFRILRGADECGIESQLDAGDAM